MAKKRRLDLELLRIIAAFFVIFNHTGYAGFMLFSNYGPHSARFWLYLAVSVFCKLSVPVFLMITGALMLQRETVSLKALWRNKVFHMFVVFVFWSLFYYLVAVKRGGLVFNIKQFIVVLYSDTWNYPFWFLLLYMATMICLPLLQRIAKSLTNREYLYLFAVYAVFAMGIPFVQLFLFRGNYEMAMNYKPGWLMADGFIYPLVGYFLEHRAKKFWNKKRLCLLLTAGLCGIACTGLMVWYRGRINTVYDEWDHKTFVFLIASAVFVAVQQLGSRTGILERFRGPITSLGGCTFGIYLLHSYLLQEVHISGTVQRFILEHLPSMPLIAVLLYCAVIFLIGYAVTWILKNVPFVKNLLA